jgi:hypothetical protein
MDNSFLQQETNIQQPSGFLASLQIFDRIIHWLAGLLKLKEEEQEDAGVYLGHLGNE